MRPLPLLTALLLATLLPAAAASAKPVKFVSYAVTVEGSADYDYVDAKSDAHANYTWRTEFPLVLFRNDRAFTESPDNLEAKTTGTVTQGEMTRQLAGDTAHCAVTSPKLTASSGRFFDTEYVAGTDPYIKLRALNQAFPDFEGCPDQSAASFDVAGRLVGASHTYDTFFTFPREAIGMGKVIQLVEETVTDKRCPGNLTGSATSCRLSFKATVTFDKRNELLTDDEEPVVIGPEDLPPLGPGPGPAPADPLPLPPPAPAPPAGLLAPVAAKDAKLAAGAASAVVPVACSAVCAGEVVAVPLGRKATAAAARVLGRARFTAKPGKPARVTVRFRAAARRAIRRARGVRLTVRATSAGRPAATQTVALRLR